MSIDNILFIHTSTVGCTVSTHIKNTEHNISTEEKGLRVLLLGAYNVVGHRRYEGLACYSIQTSIQSRKEKVVMSLRA